MIEAVKLAGAVIFILALMAGASVTLARVIRYQANGWRRPSLLTRDIQVIGGLAITVTLVLMARALQALGYDVSGLSTDLTWLLLTTVPVCWAVVVYAIYEIFVIERGGTQPYSDREHPGDGA